MNSKYLKLIFTFDMDPDNFDFHVSNNYRSEISWEGLEVGCKKAINCIEDIFKQNVKCTWFARADNQIEQYMGRKTSFLENFEKLIQYLCDKEQLIGFHPHLERFDNKTNKWILENSLKDLLLNFELSFNSFKRFGLSPKVVRIGGNLSEKNLFIKMQEVGVEIDSSALPGRYRKDKERSFDWRKTPNRIFKPSLKEPQIPGNPSLKFFEIPFTMHEIKTSYDKKPIKRYLDFTFDKDLLKYFFNENLSNLQYLLIICHPSLLCDKVKRNSHALLKYGEFNFKENLKNLKNALDVYKIKYNFLTLKELVNINNDKFS